MIKNIGLFITGALVGGGVTYLVASKYYEEVLTSYQVRYADSNELPEDTITSCDAAAEEAIQERGAGPIDNGISYVSYNKQYRTESDKNEQDDRPFFDLDDLGEEEYAEFPEGSIYLISETEFITECQHFDKRELQYFTDDDALYDESEEINIITDIDGIVGQEALDYLLGQEQDRIWVRNEKLAVDYEILRINNSYSEVILGYSSPSSKAKKSKKVSESAKKKKEVSDA